MKLPPAPPLLHKSADGMDTTYTLRAADGKEYGPVTLVQIIAWVHEGRVAELTELRRSDMQHWALASDFDELKFLFSGDPSTPAGSAPQTITAPPESQRDAAIVHQMRSGASWFYWIAALSMVNSISAAFGASWRFFFGLGITQVFDVLGAQMGGPGRIVAFVLDLAVAGVLVLFGALGSKGRLWTFVAGISLLAIDSLLFLLAKDWIGVAFHIFVLYCLYRGMRACRALRP